MTTGTAAVPAAIAAPAAPAGDAYPAAQVATTYQTLESDVLDLSGLTAEERAFFGRCYAAYREGMLEWGAFTNLIAGHENPLVRSTGGWITRAVAETPLYRAVRDLEDRVGLRDGKLTPEPEYDLDRDPIADEWLPASAAAARKGVARDSLHEAIRRGAVIARPARPGGSWLVVSANSLARWTPVAVRQAAGRARTRRVRPAP